MTKTVGARDRRAQILLDHLAHEVAKRDRGAPAEALMGFARIATERFNFGRPEIARIDLDQDLAGLGIDADLIRTASAPLDGAVHMREGALDELAHRMGLAGREH